MNSWMSSLKNVLYNFGIAMLAKFAPTLTATLAVLFAYFAIDVEYLFGQVLASLPETVAEPLLPLKLYFEYANLWLPLSEVLKLEGLYAIFLIQFITTKLTCKLFTLGFVG